MADETTATAEQTQAGEAGAEAAPAEAQAQAPAQDASVVVHDAELPEVHDTSARTGTGQVDILLDTTMPVSVRLGEVEAQVRDLLQMGPGAVLKLDRRVGDTVDLYLRGIRFATGHLVVVGDRIGIRVKEILEAPEG